MYLTKNIKEDIFKIHGKSEKDSGSAEGQIALFTTRINHLTKHLKEKFIQILKLKLVKKELIISNVLLNDLLLKKHFLKLLD